MTKEERNVQIVALLKGGKSLQEIGDLYGITRAAVSLIAIKSGLGRPRLRKSMKPKTNHYLLRWGCGRACYERLRGMHALWSKTPLCDYAVQRAQAKRRGIAWNLTLVEWWEIWEESERYAERGIGVGQYRMARSLDLGAYEVGNVVIELVNVTYSGAMRDLDQRARVKAAERNLTALFKLDTSNTQEPKKLESQLQVA